ncbi:hypothetical protein [Phocaeicola plebeius]|mgnify:FL=1|uniref:hypothetical protein n=1 Tax=Phocaeicola plebeius TaxID=310297 RepID=UPI0019564370|nr:hypothetical protein [Phocaeicola plebeius]MBM6842407.1 hypothetical protein [Phocaeicola plebeius]
MARQKNDGRGRLGGRAAGTPNKVSGTLKEWLTSLIDKNRAQIEKDLQDLEPKERLQMMEKLMQYVIPKQAAQQVKLDFDNMTDEQLEQLVNEITKEV